MLPMLVDIGIRIYRRWCERPSQPAVLGGLCELMAVPLSLSCC